MKQLVVNLQDRIIDNGLWLTALLTVIVFGGLFLYADGRAVLYSLGQTSFKTVVIILGFASLGYIFRFCKWHFYLRRVGVDISIRSSLITFLSGLMMVITPGKAGELWKAWFLRDKEDVPLSVTTSVVGAERITDVIALAAMAATGLVTFGRSSVVLLGVSVLLAVGIALIQWRRFCMAVLNRLSTVPIVGEYASGLEELYDSTYALFRGPTLAFATLLSLCAWGLEGVALWYILDVISGEATLLTGTFVFGLGSVIGAVSLLPGGLGATEASMIGLLRTFGYSEITAAVATLLIRLGTLWYAATLGLTTFSWYSFNR